MPIKNSNFNNEVFLESQSPVDFNTTVDRLIKKITEQEWKVSNVYDLQKTLGNNGMKIMPVKVFSLCHPKHSGRILGKSDERIVSSMMPCRLSVYKKEDGKTYISRMNSSIIASQFGGLVEEVMAESANEVEQIVRSVFL